MKISAPVLVLLALFFSPGLVVIKGYVKPTKKK